MPDRIKKFLLDNDYSKVYDIEQHGELELVRFISLKTGKMEYLEMDARFFSDLKDVRARPFNTQNIEDYDMMKHLSHYWRTVMVDKWYNSTCWPYTLWVKVCQGNSQVVESELKVLQMDE